LLPEAAPKVVVSGLRVPKFHAGEFMSYRGGATFAWQPDYRQFYVVDSAHTLFQAPEDITSEMMLRRWHGMATGLAVYTNDCLQQLIEIGIFGSEPPLRTADWRSGRAWTQVETTVALFPSKQFTLASPSRGGPDNYGPDFRVDSETTAVRIHWMEFQGSRRDDTPVEPDVIRLEFWPIAT
jgi:hypothetical protein